MYVCSNDGGLVEERPVEARPWNEARVSQMWRQRERERVPETEAEKKRSY